ncbi:hypothetical protein ACIBG0_40170 [Nocardia sp. NPDC050630]|uniref:hypothetical protein n=1 Tax=Nocardia sp. NPDC050630 TaxID=3364321 RepID=UPI0037A76171
MSDIVFPARLTATRDVDLDGLPILMATVTPDSEAAALPLPPGQTGPQGPRGRPRSTFVKAGTIANAAARPTGLGPDDRGRWWHRLDDNGMDVWTGAAWVHSPGAVGAQGPVAPAATIATVTTTHDPALTTPALRISAEGAALAIAATAPAGVAGLAGPPGASGSIATAEDYDNTTGPTQRSMFALNLGGRRWSTTAPPNGFGPWSWWDADIAADQLADVDQLIALTAAVPALPFRWRPMCFGNLYTYCETGTGATAEVRVRLGSATGVMVASGAGLRAATSQYLMIPFNPTFGDEGTKPLSPSSTYATVPAGVPATLLLTVERVGTGADIGYDNARGSLTVWAQPV